jgi:hypothetical protein
MPTFSLRRGGRLGREDARGLDRVADLVDRAGHRDARRLSNTTLAPRQRVTFDGNNTPTDYAPVCFTTGTLIFDESYCVAYSVFVVEAVSAGKMPVAWTVSPTLLTHLRRQQHPDRLRAGLLHHRHADPHGSRRGRGRGSFVNWIMFDESYCVAYSVFVVEAVSAGKMPVANNTPTDYAPVCFTTGTLIRTDRGEVAVEDLQVGDWSGWPDRS